MDAKREKSFKRNLRRFRKWLSVNAVAQVIRGFLPTFLDDQSKQLGVVVNDGMQSLTDGSTIVLSLIPPVLEDWYSEEDWMMCLKALAAHEAQHVNSSNFSDIALICEWYGKYLSDNYSLDESIGQSIAKEALNIVEDGRIERIAVTRRPGMFIPFQFLNQIIRNNLAITQKADSPKGEYADFWNNLISYAHTGLYSPGIQVYAGTRLESVFLGIRSLADAGIDSKTSENCREYVQELLEDVSPYITDLIKASPELEEALKGEEAPEYTSNQGTADTSNQSGGAGGGSSNPLRAPSPSSSSSEQAQQDTQDDIDTQSPSQSEQSGCDYNSSNSDSEQNTVDKSSDMSGFEHAEPNSPPISDSELDEIRNMLARDLENANSEKNSSQSQSSEVLDAKGIEDIRAQYTGRTLPVKQSALCISGNDELPPEMKSQAMVLRREIVRIQDSRNKTHKGLRRGMIDPGALWKTGLRDDRIFTRRSHPDASSVAIYLLIDNSGSMRDKAFSAGGKSLPKYQAARYAAAVIEEAVKGLVPYKVALFDQSSGNVNHKIIKGFDEKGGTNRTWNSLKEIGTGGGNADSVNIRIAAEELIRRPERKKVQIVLSDGTPSAYASRAEGYTEVAEAVSSVRRKGIILIPIMFGDSNFLSTAYKTYEMMYEKNIIACEPREIIEKLSGLFRQVICR